MRKSPRFVKEPCEVTGGRQAGRGGEGRETLAAVGTRGNSQSPGAGGGGGGGCRKGCPAPGGAVPRSPPWEQPPPPAGLREGEWPAGWFLSARTFIHCSRLPPRGSRARLPQPRGPQRQPVSAAPVALGGAGGGEAPPPRYKGPGVGRSWLGVIYARGAGALVVGGRRRRRRKRRRRRELGSAGSCPRAAEPGSV